MSIQLRKKRRGDRLTVEDYNLLVDAIHERDLIIPPSGVSGLRATPTSRGIILKKIPDQASDGSGSQLTDFALFDASTSETCQIGVYSGTVTPQGPLNFAAGVSNVPSEFTAADVTSPTCALAVTLSGELYLKTTVDPDPAGDGSQPPIITALDVIAQDFSTILSNGPTTVYQVLGAYSVTMDEAGNTSLTVLSGAAGIGPQNLIYVGGTGTGTGYYYSAAG